MKTRSAYLIITLIITLNIFSQTSSKTVTKYYDELEHIAIDSIIYYENPYITVCNKPLETFKPIWYMGYCATNYPEGFKDYIKEANAFLMPSVQLSEFELNNYYTSFKQLACSDFKRPFRSFYGDIYFTHKATQKNYIMTLSYNYAKEIKDFDLNKVNLAYFQKESSQNKSLVLNKDTNFNKIYKFPTIITFLELNGGVYKACNNQYITENILQNGNLELPLKGYRFDEFFTMLKRSDKYILSRMVNGKRTFKIVIPSQSTLVSSNVIWYIGITILLLILLMLAYRKKTK